MKHKSGNSLRRKRLVLLQFAFCFLQGKRPRPKRSLASRLAGYLPPRKQQSAAAVTNLSEMLENAKMSELKKKTELLEPVVAN